MSRSMLAGLRRRVHRLFATPASRDRAHGTLVGNAAARERAERDAVRQDIYAHNTWQRRAYERKLHEQMLRDHPPVTPSGLPPQAHLRPDTVAARAAATQAPSIAPEPQDAYQRAITRQRQMRDEIARNPGVRNGTRGFGRHAAAVASGTVWGLTLLAAVILLGAVLLASEGARTAVGFESIGQKIDRLIGNANGVIADAGQSTRDRVEAAGDSVKQAGKSLNDRSVAAFDAGAARVDEAGAHLSDAAITASIKTDLLKDPFLSALRVEVSTVKGEVTLRGSANSEVSRERAGRMAAAIAGVKKVHNDIVVGEERSAAMARR
jgi:osmotically-inducible protein OsmY